MEVTTRATEQEIKESYEGQVIAEQYVDERFQSELRRLQHDKQVGAVNRWIAKSGPTRVLEIAPGPGRLTREISFQGEHVCLEYNQGMIDVGSKASASHVQWVQGNAFELPTDEQFAEPFDFAYTFRFIRHFKREDRDRLYAQLHRVLRPEALLLFDAVNEVVSKPLRDAKPESYPIYDVLYSDIDELRQELADAGFEMIACERVHNSYMKQRSCQRLVGPRVNLLNRLFIRMLERFSRGPCLEWIVICRRA